MSTTTTTTSTTTMTTMVPKDERSLFEVTTRLTLSFFERGQKQKEIIKIKPGDGVESFEEEGTDLKDPVGDA